MQSHRSLILVGAVKLDNKWTVLGKAKSDKVGCTPTTLNTSLASPYHPAACQASQCIITLRSFFTMFSCFS